MDDTPPVPLKRRDWRLPMVAAAVVMVAIIALIAWRLRKRKPKPLQPVVVMAPALRPRKRLSGPAERALAELDALDQAGTLVAEPRDGYDELVAILRRFANEQFGVAILDRTTDELLASLARSSFPPDVLPGARTWFARCDLVKYAAERPAADRSHLDLEDARGLVIASVGGVIAPAAPAASSEEAADA